MKGERDSLGSASLFKGLEGMKGATVVPALFWFVLLIKFALNAR
jgi:hypothetical protein